MIHQIEAVILAGGLGSRMGQITTESHKSLLEVSGKPILTHILDGLQSEFGSARVVLATGHNGEKIKTRYGARYGNIGLEYVHDPAHLEVRKRLLLADGLIDGSFFVIGADVIVHPTQYSAMARTLESERAVHGVISGATDISPAPTHALIYAEGNNVAEIQTSPPFNNGRPYPLRDMSLWLLDQRTMQFLKQAPDGEPNISPVLNEAIKQGARYAIERYHGKWHHFGQPEDLNVNVEFV